MEPSIRPLKIAFFVEGMYASGVDTSTQLLAKALRRLGHHVVVFMPWKQHCSMENPENLFLLRAARINPKQAVYLTYPLSMRLITEFKNQEFDLIHIHTSTSINLLAWQVAKLFDLPIIYTYHTMSKEYIHYLGSFPARMSSWLDSFIELLDKLVCNRANVVLTPSHKAAKYLAELNLSQPVIVLPNGIDLDAFYPFPSDYLYVRFGVPQNLKKLLFVGRLNQEKRPLLAYTLFRKLCQQCDDVCLVMVGDGAYREQLWDMAVQDGLTKRLFLTGLIEYAKMPAVYNAADLWVSTSQSEVHPMAALEAVACGLPVVAFRDSALNGVVEDKVNGFLVDNEEAFLAKLQTILHDGKLYQQMSRAAIEHIQPYSIEATATRLLHCYANIMYSNQQKSPPRKDYLSLQRLL